MSNDVAVYQLVRNPDDRYDNENICALTRKRLLDQFPETSESFIQENAFLVKHPYLHPKFSKRLLPADKLYETLRDEAYEELREAVFKLGATEVCILNATDESRSETQTFNAEVKIPAGEVDTSRKRSEEQGQSKRVSENLLKHENPIDINSLDKDKFFNELVYNKDNKALKILFDGIKSGQKFKEYKLEFKNSIIRNHKLEVQVRAAYKFVLKCEIGLKFEDDYKNYMEVSTTFVAKF